MRTIIIDNYDSFTYNLFQYVAEAGGNPIVKKNDEVSLRQIEKLKPTHIIISPGPGTPTRKKNFGICAGVIKKYAGKIPILGVCLGHQGIVHVFGGKIKKAPWPMHGMVSEVSVGCVANVIKECNLHNIFRGLPRKISVMRYHSLIVDAKKIPKDFVVTARTTKDKLVMAVQHKAFPLYGIQFHPESFETPHGKKIIRNFLGTSTP